MKLAQHLLHGVESKIRMEKEMSRTERTVVFYKNLRSILGNHSHGMFPFDWEQFIAWWERLCHMSHMLICDCAMCFLCVMYKVHVLRALVTYLPGPRAIINKWLQSAWRSLDGRSYRNANYYYFLGHGKKTITCRLVIVFFYFIVANECD